MANRAVAEAGLGNRQRALELLEKARLAGYKNYDAVKKLVDEELSKRPVSKGVDHIPTPKPAPAPSSTQKPAPTNPTPKKKKSSRKIVLGIVIALFVVGALISLIVNVVLPKVDSYNETSTTGTEYLSDYDKIFEGQKFKHSFTGSQGTRSKSFAKKNSDGTVECIDFEYTDDVVSRQEITKYFPTSGYTASEKKQLTAELEKAAEAEEQKFSFCYVTVMPFIDYHYITFSYLNLTNPDHYYDFYLEDYLDADSYISMSATEESLLSDGYVMK